MLAKGLIAPLSRRRILIFTREGPTLGTNTRLDSASPAPRGISTSSSTHQIRSCITRSTPRSMSAPQQQPSGSAPMSTTRTAMRQAKLVVSAPPTVPRLTGSEPLLATMDGAAQLLDELKPAFTTELHLQAIGLSGRQLPLLTKDEHVMPHLFNAAGVRYVQPHPNGDPAQRILLLNVPASAPTPDIILATVQKHSLELIPDFALQLGYDHLSSDQILEALLPLSIVETEGVPSGFTIVGHIAHLNLLDVYLPFRFLVGHVIRSKHAATLRTVVNKLDTIDTEFRFFKMELLAGEPEYTARVSESDCTFEFDFRSVYWNSRLHAEHMRLIKRCRPNQVLADVMAGVGPFAVPAAKRGTWVLANDLNPSSHDSLVKNAAINKVLLPTATGEGRVDGGLVGTCMDGREFVRWSMVETWKRAFAGRPKGYDGGDAEREDDRLRDDARKKLKDRAKKQRELHAAKHNAKNQPATTQDIVQRTSELNLSSPSSSAPHAMGADVVVERWGARKLVDHFVMNLPATALEFLDAYQGAYTYLAQVVGEDELRAELSLRSTSRDASMLVTPMVHVHCFSKNPFTPALDILNRANTALGIPPDAEHRLRGKPITPPPQTFAGLRKSSATTTEAAADGEANVGNYLTSHPDYPRYSHLSNHEEFMLQVEREWQQRDEGKVTEGLEIHYVRDVAPNKQMYCLSFPLPSEVLWAPIQP